MTDHSTDTTKRAAIAEILLLLAADPRYRTLALTTALAKVLPAVEAGQYAIGYREIPNTAGQILTRLPVAFVLYAQLSDQVYKTFLRATKPADLPADGWNSGKNIWIVESIGDRDGLKKLIALLYEGNFGGRSFTAHVAENGKYTSRVFTGP